MINEEVLIAAGYKKYVNHNDEVCKRLFQKVVRDSGTDEKKYFINVYEWDFSCYRSDLPPSYAPEALMFWEDGSCVTLKPDDFNSIEDVELFFEKFYNVFDCVPDLDNN